MNGRAKGDHRDNREGDQGQRQPFPRITAPITDEQPGRQIECVVQNRLEGGDDLIPDAGPC